jgi:hypothetical protein
MTDAVSIIKVLGGSSATGMCPCQAARARSIVSGEYLRSTSLAAWLRVGKRLQAGASGFPPLTLSLMN